MYLIWHCYQICILRICSNLWIFVKKYMFEKPGSSRIRNSIRQCLPKNNNVARSRKHRENERIFWWTRILKQSLKIIEDEMKFFCARNFCQHWKNDWLRSKADQSWNHEESRSVWPLKPKVSLVTLLPKIAKVFRSAMIFKGFGRRWAWFLREKTYIFEILMKNCFT